MKMNSPYHQPSESTSLEIGKCLIEVGRTAREDEPSKINMSFIIHKLLLVDLQISF